MLKVLLFTVATLFLVVVLLGLVFVTVVIVLLAVDWWRDRWG